MNCQCTQGTDGSGLTPDALAKTQKHPCFSFEAHHKYARMHLPVAPRCNLSCNYCNRKFDCLHESRPGVTSEVLTPGAALKKFNLVRSKIENLSVVGIAGPGDALANWEETRRTIELIQESDPEAVFCLSTNGLLLPEYAREIIGLGIKHVTVTLNCLDPDIGAQIYRYVDYRGKRHRGDEGAKILLENQLSGIKTLAGSGVVVKVNIVMITGINDRQIPDIVKKAGELGAYITNIMPLIPAGGSVFENLPQTCMKEVTRMRKACQSDLRQMFHCRQCRADAIGLLGDDRSLEFRSAAGEQEDTVPSLPAGAAALYKIAVASKQGEIIDQHFGQASEFAIYQGNGEIFQLVENRKVKRYCEGTEECDTDFGEERKESTVSAIGDCDAVVSLRIGHQARERLAKRNILGIEHYDTVENGLKAAVLKLNERKAV